MIRFLYSALDIEIYNSFRALNKDLKTKPYKNIILLVRYHKNLKIRTTKTNQICGWNARRDAVVFLFPPYNVRA